MIRVISILTCFTMLGACRVSTKVPDWSNAGKQAHTLSYLAEDYYAKTNKFPHEIDDIIPPDETSIDKSKWELIDSSETYLIQSVASYKRGYYIYRYKITKNFKVIESPIIE